jgi:hypothetical protein
MIFFGVNRMRFQNLVPFDDFHNSPTPWKAEDKSWTTQGRRGQAT